MCRLREETPGRKPCQPCPQQDQTPFYAQSSEGSGAACFRRSKEDVCLHAVHPLRCGDEACCQIIFYNIVSLQGGLKAAFFYAFGRNSQSVVWYSLNVRSQSQRGLWYLFGLFGMGINFNLHQSAVQSAVFDGFFEAGTKADGFNKLTITAIDIGCGIQTAFF